MPSRLRSSFSHIPGLHFVHYCQSMFAISAVGSNTKLAPTTGNNSLQPISFGLMQEEHQQEPYFLRAKLLEAVDADYNVKDMPIILEVLGKLEVLNVSKEILESTRLGKTVNEFRRKVNDAVLARRLKDLVKKWRDAVIPQQNHHPVNGTSEGGGSVSLPGGNRALPPSFSSGYTSASSSPILAPSPYNSNSLSPRIGAVTNYANNNISAHSLPANRNGSSSIANKSPNNNKNSQLLSASSYPNQLVSPSASTTSPFLNSRSLVSPHKSRSPGGPTLSAFISNNSNVSPFPTSIISTSTTSSYAPNSETVSRTNAANKRYRELDDSPLNSNVEPPSKKPKSAVNGTLDDPTLALDDNSRDSYASRGSAHSDGFASKDQRFSVSAPSPATPSQASVLSPQMPVPGTDSNVPSPATPLDAVTANSLQSEAQPKRKRRKKQNEYIQDTDAILREKIAQAQAEKAAKMAREKEMQLKEREASLNKSSIDRRTLFEEPHPEDKLANNSFVEGYLKSQSALRAQMEKEAVDALSASDLKGAEGYNGSNEGSLSKKEKKKHKKKHGDMTDDTSNPFPSELEILAQLPPIDPNILKEFENFQFDVNPSPPPPQPSESGTGDAFNSYNKETESVNNLKSLSSTEEKPRKLIDWGDSDDEEELLQEKLAQERQIEADIISQQVQVISEYTADPTADYLTNVALSSESIDQEQDKRGNDLDLVGLNKRDISESDVDTYTKDVVPNLNGNYDGEGQFKEWQETCTVESYKGTLHILPYTIIDF